jgi:hypothetical protein
LKWFWPIEIPKRLGSQAGRHSKGKAAVIFQSSKVLFRHHLRQSAANRVRERERGKQTDRQTDRQTHRQTHRGNETEEKQARNEDKTKVIIV